MLKKNLKLKILMGIAVIAMAVDCFFIKYYRDKNDNETALAFILTLPLIFFFIGVIMSEFDRKKGKDDK